jgi:DNA-binding transcriptional LysR family regulator
MNDRLLALKLFVRVARTGSFSRAGKDLKLSQPSASRLIASLEREVGAALFARSTRAVVLTDVGIDYLARVEPALAILEEATQAIHGKGILRGVLRIGLPASMAIREVIPRLPAFMSKHPALRVDLAMDDGGQDVIRDAIDVAIRSGEFENSSAPGRRVAGLFEAGRTAQDAERSAQPSDDDWAARVERGLRLRKGRTGRLGQDGCTAVVEHPRSRGGRRGRRDGHRCLQSVGLPC